MQVANYTSENIVRVQEVGEVRNDRELALLEESIRLLLLPTSHEESNGETHLNLKRQSCPSPQPGIKLSSWKAEQVCCAAE